MSDAPPILPIPWFDRSDWTRWRVIAPTALPAAYEDWLDRAETLEHDMELRSFTIQRVSVTPEHFTEWCANHALTADDAASQARYALEMYIRKA